MNLFSKTLLALVLVIGSLGCGTTDDTPLMDASAIGNAADGAVNSEGRDTVDMSESVSADTGMFGLSDAGLADTAPTPMDDDMGIVDMAIPSPTSCLDDAEDGSVFSFSGRSLASGNQVPMCEYEGNAILFVNTAANCGFTPQYAQLEMLNRRYTSRPLKILGFLSNDFGNQGGTLDEVEQCNEQYMVTFEQFYHVGVTSTSRQGQDPLFAWLTTQPGLTGEVQWNFTKFLVAYDGTLLARWSHTTPANDPQFLEAVEAAVGRAELWQQ